jgi:antirestriction protein ArdC
MKNFENDVAYIEGWLQKLKEDKRFILFASSKAQKAVDYILNQPFADNQTESESIETQVN